MHQEDHWIHPLSQCQCTSLLLLSLQARILTPQARAQACCDPCPRQLKPPSHHYLCSTPFCPSVLSNSCQVVLHYHSWAGGRSFLWLVHVDHHMVPTILFKPFQARCESQDWQSQWCLSVQIPNLGRCTSQIYTAFWPRECFCEAIFQWAIWQKSMPFPKPFSEEGSDWSVHWWQREWNGGTGTAGCRSCQHLDLPNLISNLWPLCIPELWISKRQPPNMQYLFLSHAIWTLYIWWTLVSPEIFTEGCIPILVNIFPLVLSKIWWATQKEQPTPLVDLVHVQKFSDSFYK